jgi:hypothetical protein
MLQKTSELVADCHRRAFECNENAKAATNAEDRQFYLDMERRWLFLARSYELTDRLTTMSDDIDRRRNS